MTAYEMIPPAKPIIGQEEHDAVGRVLASGMIAQGPEVAAFEQEFSAALARGREVVLVNSGTPGQHLGMLAPGLKPGVEVIVPYADAPSLSQGSSIADNLNKISMEVWNHGFNTYRPR